MAQATPPVLFPPLLLATDGSQSARAAQRLLYPIAQTLQDQYPSSDQSTVTVLTIQPRRSSRSNRLTKSPAQRLHQSEPASEAEPPFNTTAVTQGRSPTEDPGRLTADIRAEFPATITVSVQVRRGRPATEILNYARTAQAGLIAVGQRGIGGVREMLLGSISAVIARYAPCSVLIARGGPTRADAAPTLQHVLLLVNDDTAAVRKTIAVVHQLLPIGIRRVTLLCVQPPLNAGYLFGPFVTPTPSWQLNQSLQEAQKEQGEDKLRQAKAGLDGTPLEVQTLLQIGEAGPAVCQVAQQQQVDLIILGSQVERRSLLSPLQTLRPPRQSPKAEARSAPLRNTRLSGVEDYVIHHAPCPVLLCRAG